MSAVRGQNVHTNIVLSRKDKLLLPYCFSYLFFNWQSEKLCWGYPWTLGSLCSCVCFTLMMITKEYQTLPLIVYHPGWNFSVNSFFFFFPPHCAIVHVLWYDCRITWTTYIWYVWLFLVYLWVPLACICKQTYVLDKSLNTLQCTDFYVSFLLKSSPFVF